MDHDLLLVLGLGMLVLSIPSLMAALIDDRPPFVAGLGITLGIGMAGWSVIMGDRSINPATLPHLFIEVLGRYLP